MTSTTGKDAIERSRTEAIGLVAVMLMCAVGLVLMLAPVPVVGAACATGTAPAPELRAKSGNPTPGEAVLLRSRGASSPEGERLQEVVGDVAAVGLPPGTVVEIVDQGSITTTESGSGVGAGATAIGDKLSESFDGSAPNVGLSGGGGASGGGVKRTGKASAFVPPEGLASNPLIWAGIACGLLAVAAGVYMRNIKAAMALGGLGAAFIVAALFPGFLLLIVAGAAVVGGVVYLRSEVLRVRATESARAMAPLLDHPALTDEQRKANAAVVKAESVGRDLVSIAEIRAKDAALPFAAVG